MPDEKKQSYRLVDHQRMNAIIDSKVPTFMLYLNMLIYLSHCKGLAIDCRLTRRPEKTIMKVQMRAVRRVPTVWDLTLALRHRATEVPARLVSTTVRLNSRKCTAPACRPTRTRSFLSFHIQKCSYGPQFTRAVNLLIIGGDSHSLESSFK